MPETHNWEFRRQWERENGRFYPTFRMSVQEATSLEAQHDIGKFSNQIYGIRGIISIRNEVDAYLRAAGVADGLGFILINSRLNDYQNRQIEEVCRTAIDQYRLELPSELQIRNNSHPDREFILDINDLARYSQLREEVRVYFPTTPAFWYQNASEILYTVARNLGAARYRQREEVDQQ